MHVIRSAFLCGKMNGCHFKGKPLMKSHMYIFARDLDAQILLDFSHTVKAATLILISGCGSAILSSKEGKSGFIYNLVKS